jgi:hypothetical protein
MSDDDFPEGGRAADFTTVLRQNKAAEEAGGCVRSTSLALPQRVTNNNIVAAVRSALCAAAGAFSVTCLFPSSSSTPLRVWVEPYSTSRQRRSGY